MSSHSSNYCDELVVGEKKGPTSGNVLNWMEDSSLCVSRYLISL